jgi:FkbM family methyltransferase
MAYIYPALMKKFIYGLVDLYLSPLQRNAKLALFAKYRILQHNEHLRAAVHMIHRKYAKPEGLILDVGAYNGSTTVFFAQNFRRSKVIGFEPNPATFPEAQQRCAPYPSINLMQTALDSENGELDFFVSDQNLSSSLNPIKDNPQFHLQKKIKVQVKRLDDCIPENEEVLLIKLDTQGRELKILSGGTRTLQRTKYVLTEMNNHDYYQGGSQYYELDDFLRNRGFKLVNITSSYTFGGLTEYDALYENSKVSA